MLILQNQQLKHNKFILKKKKENRQTNLEAVLVENKTTPFHN